MFRTAISLLLMLLAAPDAPAQAPAFYGAEQRLVATERAVASATPRPATMAARAGAWRRLLEREEGRAFTEAERLDRQLSRIEELQEILRQDRAMRRLEQPQAVFARPSSLEQRCLGAVLRDCRVTATGLVVSEDRATRILWQSQRGFTERDGIRAGIVLLAQARGGWRLVGWSFAGVSYGAPILSKQPDGLLLSTPGLLSGSGSGNADLVYQLRRGSWHEIEIESWQDQMDALLPPGLGLRRGIAYDFAEMTAPTNLWRDTDADCCATAGRATLKFSIRGASLVLDAVALDNPATPAIAACPSERASYRLMSSRDFTVELLYAGPGTGADSDLLIKLRSGRTHREYWFRFVSAQGYGGVSLLPVEPPGPTVETDGIQPLPFDDVLSPLLGIHVIGDDLTVWQQPPRRGIGAPRHLFMPGIGTALHYGLLPHQDGRPGNSETIAPGFWLLDACR